jgi:hypothetical protein
MELDEDAKAKLKELFVALDEDGNGKLDVWNTITVAFFIASFSLSFLGGRKPIDNIWFAPVGRAQLEELKVILNDDESDRCFSDAQLSSAHLTCRGSILSSAGACVLPTTCSRCGPSLRVSLRCCCALQCWSSR